MRAITQNQIYAMLFRLGGAVASVRIKQLSEVAFDVAVSGRKAEAAYRIAAVKGSRLVLNRKEGCYRSVIILWPGIKLNCHASGHWPRCHQRARTLVFENALRRVLGHTPAARQPQATERGRHETGLAYDGSK